MLRLLDLTLRSPAENLALDEALLLAHDRALQSNLEPTECLRFWESSIHFVTLGVSAKLLEDVEVKACARDGVPILRRASGGGTVLEGPGSLNYTLVLSIDQRSELRDVTRSYRIILGCVARAIGVEGARQHGTSDLALGGVKFSGNAQKRTRRAILHHGTLLWSFDLGLIPRYLREPEKQPDYRARRPHSEFVRNLDLPVDELKRRIAAAWGAEAEAVTSPIPDLEALLSMKYQNRGWIERF